MTKSVILRKELLLAVLFLFAVFDNIDACGSTCRGRRLKDGRCEEDNSWHRRWHRRRYFGKRSVNVDANNIQNYYDYDEGLTANTSCGESVCTSTQNYPFESISDAVNQVRRILASHNPYLERQKKRMDPEVLNFHSKPKHESANVDQTLSADGCKYRVNITHLQEGYSSDDRKTYYIVNIPSLQQRVHMLECITGEGSCSSNDVDSSTANGALSCLQSFRQERLLVLPARNGYAARFLIDDFKVRSFWVPNGCSCGVNTDLSVVHL